MHEMEKAFIEEINMMHGRQILQTDFLELLKEKAYNTDSSKRKFGEKIELKRLKLWRRGKRCAISNETNTLDRFINYSGSLKINEIKRGIWEVKNNLESLLERSYEELTKVKEQLQ